MKRSRKIKVAIATAAAGVALLVAGSVSFRPPIDCPRWWQCTPKPDMSCGLWGQYC